MLSPELSRSLGLRVRRFGSGPVEPHLVWQGPVACVATPPFRVLGLCLFIHCDAVLKDRTVDPDMTFGRAYELQVAVLVFMVIPTHEGERPGLGLFKARKSAREVRSILGGAKEALRIGVIVTDPRAAVPLDARRRRRDVEFMELGQIRRSLHGAAIVLMDDERLARDPFAAHGLFDQYSRVIGPLFGVDLVGHDLAGVHIKDEVEKAMPHAA